jgi:cytochrome d ubiquinol oxidase subunit I
VDVELLSRLQFALTIGFHYIFPPLSIGLGVLLVAMEGTYLVTKAPVYQQMTRFFVRVFGLTFAIGVATGIVMEFEFGTNWATYSRFVGDVFGSALAAEGIFAFFLESGFLALLLFGWDKVGPRLHFLSTILVCLGAHFSAIWIIVANSWMQTPVGYHLVTDAAGRTRAEITDFWALVFNPSSVDRLLHTVVAAWSAGAFFVLSIAAYYLLKRRHEVFAQATMRIGLALAVVAALASLVTGDLSAKGVAKQQPEKFAAMEGVMEASGPAAVHVLGWVDEANRRVVGIEIPGLLSWMVTGDAAAPIPGVKAFPAKDLPPLNLTFQGFHLMVAIGVGLIALAVIGVALLPGGRLFRTTWLLRVFIVSVLGPQLANQLGWMTAEVGRQPWIVYKLMRTADGLSRVVTAPEVLFSLVLFTAIYLLLFVLFLYLLDQKIAHGPLDDDLPADARHRA